MVHSGHRIDESKFDKHNIQVTQLPYPPIQNSFLVNIHHMLNLKFFRH